MKKINTYLMVLLACVSVLFVGCNDDELVNEEYNNERLFMPMFRMLENTNNSSDQYGSTVANKAPNSSSNFVNDVQLYWYGVEGASGYRLRAKIQGTDWEKNSVLDVVLGPEVLEFLHEDLQYSTGYAYAIQALSPKGEAYNSKWYGYGDGSHPKDYLTITTGLRYDVPSVFWTENVTKTSLRVYFNRIADSGYETTYKDFIEAGAEIKDGNWVFDEIQLVPTADNPDLPTLSHPMTDADFAAGYVDFDGLMSNGSYIVQGQNSHVDRYFDRQYNKTMLRMLGDPNEAIIIPAIYDPNDSILAQRFVPELQAARLDTVLTNYMGDNTIAEGQVFYLEGGKYYYISTNVELTKGFTLETNPEDLATKGRATIYLGVGATSSTKTQGSNQNFNLARNAKSGAENGVTLTIQDIRFNEINFRPQIYYNFFDVSATKDGNSKLSLSANYFMNMSSQGLSFSLSELSVTNCSFSGCVRGFIRFQGPNRQIIQKLTVSGCVFHDDGLYDNTGRGYSWFAGPGNKDQRYSNFYQDLTFSNNTIVNSPRHALVSENGQTAWPTYTKWKITIENNTIINFSPRSNNAAHGLFLEIRYAPGGSSVTVRKNLFVSVRKGDFDSDPRTFYMKGMRVDTKNINYNFADNYATTVPTWKVGTTTWSGSNLVDGLFTIYSFSNSADGAGYLSGAFNTPGGLSETKIKFGDNANGNEPDGVGYQLTPEELFKNPTPKATEGYKDANRHDVDGFYYNTSAKVTGHPIYTKGIGDQRWKTGGRWK